MAATGTTSSAPRRIHWLVGRYRERHAGRRTANGDALVGGDGNDQFEANGNSNTLDGGTGEGQPFVAGGGSEQTFGWATATTGWAQRQRSSPLRRQWRRLDRLDRALARVFGESGNDSLLGGGNNHFLIGGDGTTGSGSAAIRTSHRRGGHDYLAATAAIISERRSRQRPDGRCGRTTSIISFSAPVPGKTRSLASKAAPTTMSSICAGSGWRTSPPLIRT